MNVVGIVLIVALAGLVLYLAIDTTIYIVKKVKLKKQQQQIEEEQKNQDTSN